MPTTRRRVNLTLTEDEERALKQLADPHSIHHQVLAGRTRPSGTGRSNAAKEGRLDADLIHRVLAIGLAQLDEEASAASYVAEAAERSEAEHEVTAALRPRHVTKATQDAA